VTVFSFHEQLGDLGKRDEQSPVFLDKRQKAVPTIEPGRLVIFRIDHESVGRDLTSESSAEGVEQ
jgi:hypothetical protein